MLPAGRPVDLRLRSQDVIHGFFIPGMRLKQDAIPGMEGHLQFTPTIPGDYPILCSQVCGLGHDRMQARLRVVSLADFNRWLAARERALARRARRSHDDRAADPNQGGISPQPHLHHRTPRPRESSISRCAHRRRRRNPALARHAHPSRVARPRVSVLYGVPKPEDYLALVTMHGTLMVFFVLTVVPQSAFPNLVLPSQIGADRMALPASQRRRFLDQRWPPSRAPRRLLRSSGLAYLRLDQLSAAAAPSPPPGPARAPAWISGSSASASSASLPSAPPSISSRPSSSSAPRA